ncbi:MAG: twin-arginine translocation signal domain-containing protein [Deltaproteobacteria bacterium]|nr:twin-arginine translocation signal domain-containing protein [Deltaproteobacteria bacterium]
MKERPVVTRRDFLKGTAGLVMAMGLGSPALEAEGGEERTRVILIRHPDVLGADDRVNGPILQQMLDEAVRTLAGEKNAGAAWQKFFRKTDVVGIKTNGWAALPTPKEMEDALRRRLLEVGVSEANLAVDDRNVRSNPVFQKSTALVNVRPVRTHHWAGAGTCLKNYIMFVQFPWSYHGDACSDLGKIWTLPGVKGKTRLNILVALTPQFYGRGPHSIDRRYLWPYRGLIVGTDPVSVDSVGAELLRRKRVAFFGEDRELDVQPIHIAVADKKYHLGTSDLKRIEIIKLGWQEEVLL